MRIHIVGIGFIGALLFVGIRADLLNTGSVSDPGYCTPYVVTCNDEVGTQFLGRAVSREVRLGKSGARQCDFVGATSAHVNPRVWAEAVCARHGGLAGEPQNPFFNSYSKLVPLIEAEKNNNPDIYRMLMRNNQEGPDNAQEIYDAFITLKLGGYYKPIVPTK